MFPVDHTFSGGFPGAFWMLSRTRVNISRVDWEPFPDFLSGSAARC